MHGLGTKLVNFYSLLYSSEHPSTSSDLDDLIEGSITVEENEQLIRIPNGEEIWKTLKSMNPNKASGPDRMTMLFFRHFWEIVGVDVISTVQDFFEKCCMLPELNQTNLVLIPKVDNLSLVGQFRPSSLCNVVYKLISKIMTERLKLVVSKLISPYQLAFVPGRLLQDNYIIAAKVFNGMNHKRVIVGGWHDMEKACDRVE